MVLFRHPRVCDENHAFRLLSGGLARETAQKITDHANDRALPPADETAPMAVDGDLPLEFVRDLACEGFTQEPSSSY